MTAKEFVIFIRRILDKDMTTFIGMYGGENKPPHEWAEALISWLDLESEEAARQAYRQYYE